MDEKEVRAKIREKLKSGELPRTLAGPVRLDGKVPVPVDKIGSFLGETCAACSEKVTSGNANSQYDYPGGQLTFHEACDRIWTEERVRV